MPWSPPPTLDLAFCAGRGLRVVALTGAGISAESGVPTFRGESGVWQSHRPEDLATPEAFARDPCLVWQWYEWRRGVVAQARPNPAHEALAALEQTFPATEVVTQNIDGLHGMAGNRRPIELHGSLWRTRCVAGCGSREERRVPLPELPPRCACGALARPDVVWFGEALPHDALARAHAAVLGAELVLVIGTSALVQPAASLPYLALGRGAAVVEVNPDETALSAAVTMSLRARAVEAVPWIVRELVARAGGEA